LRCGGLLSNQFTAYYGFIVEFAGQTIFKICEHLAKLQVRSDRLTDHSSLCKSFLLQYFFLCRSRCVQSHC